MIQSRRYGRPILAIALVAAMIANVSALTVVCQPCRDASDDYDTAETQAQIAGVTLTASHVYMELLEVIQTSYQVDLTELLAVLEKDQDYGWTMAVVAVADSIKDCIQAQSDAADTIEWLNNYIDELERAMAHALDAYRSCEDCAQFRV